LISHTYAPTTLLVPHTRRQKFHEHAIRQPTRWIRLAIHCVGEEAARIRPRSRLGGRTAAPYGNGGCLVESWGLGVSGAHSLGTSGDRPCTRPPRPRDRRGAGAHAPDAAVTVRWGR
jgi:hypothetical protein